MSARWWWFALVGAVLLVTGRLGAWESRCYIGDPRTPSEARSGPSCSGPTQGYEGLVSARNRWIGQGDEHRQIWERAWATVAPTTPRWRVDLRYASRGQGLVGAGASPLAVLPEVLARTSVSPTNPQDAATIVQRQYEIGEFAELPDFSFSPSDWVTGNEGCPLPREAFANAGVSGAVIEDCHSYRRVLGPLNANHFGSQSRRAWRHYHGLALARAAECRTLEASLRARGAPDRFRSFVEQCAAEALSLEAVASHYLGDIWASGHMWERWGATTFDAFRHPGDGRGDYRDRAILIALTAGMIHGSGPGGAADYLLFIQPAAGGVASATSGATTIAIAPDWVASDPLTVAAPGNNFIGAWTANSLRPGRGDQFFGELYTLRGELEAGAQFRGLISCVASSQRRVVQALGWSASAAVAPLRDLEPDSEECFGQRASNAAMLQALGLDFTERRSGASFNCYGRRVVGADPDAFGFTLDCAGSAGVLASLYLLGFSDDNQTTWRRELVRLANRAYLRASAEPDGTDLARGEDPAGDDLGFSSFMGVAANQLAAPQASPHADPSLPWPRAAGTAAELERSRALALAFHRAHAADWCRVLDASQRTAVINRTRGLRASHAAKAAACETCVEMLHRDTQVVSSSSLRTLTYRPFCAYATGEPPRASVTDLQARHPLAVLAELCGCDPSLDPASWLGDTATTEDTTEARYRVAQLVGRGASGLPADNPRFREAYYRSPEALDPATWRPVPWDAGGGRLVHIWTANGASVRVQDLSNTNDPRPDAAREASAIVSSNANDTVAWHIPRDVWDVYRCVQLRNADDTTEWMRAGPGILGAPTGPVTRTPTSMGFGEVQVFQPFARGYIWYGVDDIVGAARWHVHSDLLPAVAHSPARRRVFSTCTFVDIFPNPPPPSTCTNTCTPGDSLCVTLNTYTWCGRGWDDDPCYEFPSNGATLNCPPDHACFTRTCEPCGNEGQPCCPAAGGSWRCATGVTCNAGGYCVAPPPPPPPCGDVEQSCCDRDPECLTGRACEDGICRVPAPPATDGGAVPPADADASSGASDVGGADLPPTGLDSITCGGSGERCCLGGACNWPRACSASGLCEDPPPCVNECSSAGDIACDDAGRQVTCQAPVEFIRQCWRWESPLACSSGNVCVRGAGCAPCGALAQICCAGGTCGAGLHCGSVTLRCEPTPPAGREVCNGRDDNGNGQIDEIFVCRLGQRTSSGDPACRTSCGSLARHPCVAQGDVCVWGDACLLDPESCNGIDDDCNGVVDDLPPRTCSTSCGAGTERCERGTWTGCTARAPAPERCDGLDNDCDGVVDGAAAAGACTPRPRASARCVDGACTHDCESGTGDCDGAAANGCEVDLRSSIGHCGRCGVVCSFAGAASVCVGGRCEMGPCLAGRFDCNEDAADGCEDTSSCVCPLGRTEPCYSGAMGTADVGACRRGERVCARSGAAVAWSPCDGEVLPSAEVCDGADNDCDGATDEGLSESCYGGPSGTRGVGRCAAGTRTCSMGVWGTCVGQVVPTTETCDGADNDCDNATDEGGAETSCGARANSSGTCVMATCRYTCAAGYGDCDSNTTNGCETDTRASATHCGMCGHPCASSERCSGSMCGVACAGSTPTNCGGTCVDTTANVAHCGACGNVCPTRTNAASTCSASTCGFTCNMGFGNCDGSAANGCERDLRTDNANCGTCGNACTGGRTCQAASCACPAGRTPCGGACVDTTADASHCGSCGTLCALPNATSTCTSGTCRIASCAANFADCDGNSANGCEVDTRSSNSHCGMCGRACTTGQVCSGGSCTISCGGSTPTPCGGVCVNTAGDLANCGGCGVNCPTRVNAARTCTSSSCGFICNADFGDCDGNATNGCERDLRSDATNCGGCGSNCTGGRVCQGSLCVCPVGQVICSGRCVSTASDASNCGGCGNACAAPSGGTSPCVASSCVPVCPAGHADCAGTCRPVGASCSVGAGACVRLGMVVCSGMTTGCSVSAGSPSVEVCDNLDNNCDGSTDEGLSQSCYTGPSGTQSQGRCRAGTQTCASGAWGACSGEALPTTETCNGIDDDCDGATDEVCACTPGMSRPCYGGPSGTASIGACRIGTQSCFAGGVWGACVGEVGPGLEACDNVDNDCNGRVDDLSRLCYGGPSGTAGIGVCRSGSQSCSAGTWGACLGEVRPVVEVCDSIDNNCDGRTDEGLTRSCYAGPTGTSGRGACRAGVETCSSGAWGICLGQVVPVAEACNNIDDDCDGAADEEFAGQGSSCSVPGLSGACGAGRLACRAGGTVCEQTTWPSSEVCDNADNDCDGSIDQVCIRYAFSPSGVGAGCSLWRLDTDAPDGGHWYGYNVLSGVRTHVWPHTANGGVIRVNFACYAPPTYPDGTYLEQPASPGGPPATAAERAWSVGAIACGGGGATMVTPYGAPFVSLGGGSPGVIPPLGARSAIPARSCVTAIDPRSGACTSPTCSDCGIGIACCVGTAPCEWNCRNGMDDDGDGLTDCADPSCSWAAARAGDPGATVMEGVPRCPW